MNNSRELIFQLADPPTVQKSMKCPHPKCGAYSQMHWFTCLMKNPESGLEVRNDHWWLAQCEACKEVAVWEKRWGRYHVASNSTFWELIYPIVSIGDPPNGDMPPEVAKDYEEARRIAQKSPRGAAALLRLCVQKTCIALGEKGDDLNTDIRNLVQKGLPSEVQRALDSVRVIGNNAVHPGEMAIEDDAGVVNQLLKSVNYIVQYSITRKRETDELYEKLPAAKVDAVVKRDS